MGVAILLAAPSAGGSLGLGSMIATSLGLTGTFSTMVVTGVVAGLIDASMQGLLVGFNVKEFSIAESIGATFGAMGASWAASTPSLTGTQALIQTRIHAGSINVAEQLALMSTGKQHALDFTQIACAILGASLDPQFAKANNIIERTAQNVMRTASTVAINNAFRGQLNWEQIAAQMVSSSVLDGIKPAITEGMHRLENRFFSHPSPSSQAPSVHQKPTSRKHPSNATKENIHTSKALIPDEFKRKLSLDGVIADYEETKRGWMFEEELHESYSPSIKNKHSNQEKSNLINDMANYGIGTMNDITYRGLTKY